MRSYPIPPSPSRWPTGLRVLAAAGLTALTLGFSACEKKEAAADGPKTAADAAGLQKILDLGFARQDIVDGGTSYVVEGDITFDKQRLATGRPYPNARAGKAKGQEKQASTNALIDYWKQPYITVRVDGSFPDYWRGDVEQAVQDWNSIEGSRVDLALTDDEQADITIKGDDLSRGTYGKAQFPSNGNPGYEVVINRQDAPDYRRRTTIVHEIGHCLGFRHTDLYYNGEGAAEPIGGNIIFGTPVKDDNSVMNSGSSPNRQRPWQGFSYYDVIGLQNLYPE